MTKAEQDAVERVRATIHQINGHWWNRRKRPEAPDLETLLRLATTSTLLDDPETVEGLKRKVAQLQAALSRARQVAKRRGKQMLREEALEVLPHFSSAWEPLRDIAARTGRYSASQLASRARELEWQGYVESKWAGAERTSSFKLWRSLVH